MVAAVQVQLNNQGLRLTQTEIREWLQMINRLVPEIVIFDGETVSLELSPDDILRKAAEEIQRLPEGYRRADVLVPSEVK
jgi:hypothetical protein